MAEVLHGARDSSDYAKLLTVLATFPRLGIPETTWENVGRHLWELRSKGIAVPFQDVVIASVAIENQVELWTRDTQFQMIQAVLPQLILYQEPP